MIGFARLGRVLNPRLDRTPGGRATLGGEFDQLFAPFEPELKAFVCRRVDAQAADDVMQEIRVAAYCAAGKFDGRSSLRTWVYGIALNKCRDYYRVRGKDSGKVSLDDAGEISATKDAHAASDLQHVVAGALEDLTQSQREVLELYYYGELTLPEIATALNRNLNTVKYQFYRAHSELADRLGGQEDL